jgi:hypothetical protein
MLKLVLTLILRAVAAQQAKNAAARGLLYFVAAVLTALFSLGAVACLLAALWLYVGRSLGPVAAPAIVAAALLILAVASALFFRLPRTGQRPDATNPIPELSSITRLLPSLFREHTGAILAAAVVLGLLSGSNRRRRG